jgi:hypothetical protein
MQAPKDLWWPQPGIDLGTKVPHDGINAAMGLVVSDAVDWQVWCKPGWATL